MSGPLLATLTVNERMTASDWQQDVRHLEFQLPQVAPVYDAGDIAWVHPENVADFTRFFAQLGLEANQTLRIRPRNQSMLRDLPAECTVLDLFKKYIDILGTPRRYFFEQMSLFATEKEEVSEEL